MGLFIVIGCEVEYVFGMLCVFKQIKKVGFDFGVCVFDYIEKIVDKYVDCFMVIIDDGDVSYVNFDVYVNCVVNWVLVQGLKKGEIVVFFMFNCWEYIVIWFGLFKVGVVIFLFNNQLLGQLLVYCLNIGEMCYVIIVDELVDVYWFVCDVVEIEVKFWVVDGVYDWFGDFNVVVVE